MCAVLPGSRPRETLSGMVGRRWPDGSLAKAINAFHWFHEDHCAEVAADELLARRHWGYRQ